MTTAPVLDFAVAMDQALPADQSMPVRCSNGLKDDNETDVDCGGACAACLPGRSCEVDTDCEYGRCVDRLCPERFALTALSAPLIWMVTAGPS